MNKKIIALLSASIISLSAITSALAATTTSTSLASYNTDDSNPATSYAIVESGDTTFGKTEVFKTRTDTSTWTEEQKALFETAFNRENDETTRKTALSSLVTAGLITQEDADRMLTAPMTKAMKTLDASTWTEEQKALLETAFNRENDETTRKAALSSLVTAGLITQEDADRMLTAPMTKAMRTFDTSTWTEEQKALLETAFNRENDETTRKTALSSLVTAGLITQEDADRMLTMTEHRGMNRTDTSTWTEEQKALFETAFNRENDETTRKAALSSLVTAG